MLAPAFPSQSRTPAGTTLSPAPSHNPSSRALAAMLLAAIVSALVVAADAFIDTYADGHLLLPTKPGLGIELDWDAVERYRVC